MSPLRHILSAALVLGLCQGLCAEPRSLRPSMADDLCRCLGAIERSTADPDLEQAVRRCLNNTITKHPEELVELIHQYPRQGRPFFRLGLILGGTLERSCPEYPLLKDRLQLLPARG